MKTTTLLANTDWMAHIPFWVNAIFYGTVFALAGLLIFGVYFSTNRTADYKSKAIVITTIASVLTFFWLAGATWIAQSGFVQQFETFPPNIFLVLLPTTLFVVGISLRGIGSLFVQQVSLSWLIGFQAFRIFVEIYLHSLAEKGIAPSQMTWSGYNFDILTGVTAPIVAWLWSKQKIGLNWVWVWNFMGLGCLANVVILAFLSLPTPFRQFMHEPANVFITYSPHIWLPLFLVQAALFGHLLVFRWLLLNRQKHQP